MEADELSNSLTSYEISEKILNRELVICDRPGRSKVWSVFARITNQDGIIVNDFVYCKTCAKAYKFNKQTTSNLVKHKCYINRFGWNKEISMVEEEKPTIQFIENPADNVTKLLTRWIIKDCRPYDLIQNEGLHAIFQELAKLGAKFGSDLNISRLMPTVPEIEKHISVIYERCFERVKAEIAPIKENGFGLTIGTWTNNVTKQNYIVLTIHYLERGALTFRLLGLRALESEKNQIIIQKVKEILKHFDCELSEKVAIVTDEDVFKNSPDTKHYPCVSHLLESALLKSMEEVPEVTEIISTCSKLLNFLSTVKYSSLFAGQSFNPNRGVSIYKMLNSVENNWKEIETSLQNEIEGLQYFNINIQHLKALTKTLQPFEDAIETLEDDSYATLHLVMVYLHELKKMCNTNVTEFRDLDFIESLKKALLYNLEQLVTENITILHKLALFLYPPTNKLLQFAEKEKKAVEDECIRLIKCFKTESKPIIKQEPDLPSTSMSKRRKLFLDFIESDANQDPNEGIIVEVQRYKNIRVVNSEDFNVFSWWELQKDNFPLLHKLSCTILAIPATGAASKRIFSTACNLLCEKPYQETEAEKIMFINTNSEHDEVDSYFSG